jgi:hypothetical protein
VPRSDPAGCLAVDSDGGQAPSLVAR